MAPSSSLCPSGGNEICIIIPLSVPWGRSAADHLLIVGRSVFRSWSTSIISILEVWVVSAGHYGGFAEKEAGRSHYFYLDMPPTQRELLNMVSSGATASFHNPFLFRNFHHTPILFLSPSSASNDMLNAPMDPSSDFERGGGGAKKTPVKKEAKALREKRRRRGNGEGEGERGKKRTFAYGAPLACA